MTTVITATATFDKPSYKVGDTITVTVDASAVATTAATSSTQQASLTANFAAEDGTQVAITFDPQSITITTPEINTPLTALIDTSSGNTVTDTTGRVYTVSADKKHLTAVA